MRSQHSPSIFYIVFILTITGNSLCLPSSMLAQSIKRQKKEAQQHFAQQEYILAIEEYNKLLSLKPKSAKLHYQLGLSYFHSSQYEKALPHFKIYLKFKRHEDEAILYTARAMHQTRAYTEAAYFYKFYLKVGNAKDEARFNIKKELMQTVYAQRHEKKEPAIVATLGSSINSPYDDLNAIHHPKSDNFLFFSRRVDNQFDIFKSAIVQGSWDSPESMSQRYNSAQNEILLGFPDKGYQILYQRSTPEKAVSRIDNYNTFILDTVPLDVPFPLGASQYIWSGDHCFFTEELVLFAAKKIQKEQLDLFYIFKDSLDNWSEPFPLGDQINSPFNERSPFLSKDGRTLYFSSDRPNSIGGYDVYKATFSDSLKKWSKPEGLGSPINSPGDDLFFYVLDDGWKGYLSSERNAGAGGLDIYSIYFRQLQKEQLSVSTPTSFAELSIQEKSVAKDNKKNDPSALINSLSQTKGSKNTKNIYKFSPLYYDGNSGQLVAGGEKVMRELKRLLVRYPETKLLLSCHTDDKNPLASNLFLSVQQAESIAQELVLAGALKEQIYLRGYGQQYPIAQNYNFDGSSSETGRQLNQRIDINIFNSNHLPIKIEIQEPMVSSVMQSKIAATYQQNLKGLSYKVELKKTSTLFDHKMINIIKHVQTEKQPKNPLISYTIGMAKQYNAITQILETAQNSGFGKAKVIPYINGIAISREDALILVDVYPDLKNYLAAAEE